MSVTRIFAEFAHAPVTSGPTDLMRLCLFDWLACGLAGANEDVARILRQKAESEGGRAEAVTFCGPVVPAARAALVNGATSHALDYDDTHFAHIGHTSTVILSAALSVAKSTDASIEQFLAAVLVGSEGAVRIGQYFGRDHYEIGFHQTATAGAFGATLAVARLLGLSVEQTVAALGLCSSRASGLKVQFGTMAKPLNAGLAAEAAVEAGLWARAGLSATRAGIEAFSTSHHGQGDRSALDDLGAEWRISNVSHKFHACCHGLHAMLEALGALELDSNKVQRVLINTHPRWMTVCNQTDPQTGLAAKFSYQMTAAMSLAGIDTGAISSFNDTLVSDRKLRALCNVVSVTPDENIKETETNILVALKDGETKEASFDLAAPLPFDERSMKLRRKVSSLLDQGRQNALWDAAQSDDLIAVLKSLQS